MFTLLDPRTIAYNRLAAAVAELLAPRGALAEHYAACRVTPSAQACELAATMATAVLMAHAQPQGQIAEPATNGRVRTVEQPAPKASRSRQPKPKPVSARAQRDARPRIHRTTSVRHCPHCAMPFVRAGNLARHLAKVHPDQGRPASSS